MSDKIKPIALNQSNYPILIEVYEVNEDFVTFKSVTATGAPFSARQCSNKVYFENNDGGRAYSLSILEISII
jgi:hypothetical protein